MTKKIFIISIISASLFANNLKPVEDTSLTMGSILSEAIGSNLKKEEFVKNKLKEKQDIDKKEFKEGEFKRTIPYNEDSSIVITSERNMKVGENQLEINIDIERYKNADIEISFKRMNKKTKRYTTQIINSEIKISKEKNKVNLSPIFKQEGSYQIVITLNKPTKYSNRKINLKTAFYVYKNKD